MISPEVHKIDLNTVQAAITVVGVMVVAVSLGRLRAQTTQFFRIASTPA